MDAKIKNLPENDRPYERFYHQGAKALSDRELLAIILLNGYKGESALNLADTILSKYGAHDGIYELKNTSIEELMTVKGVGKSKAIRIKAAFAIGERALVSNNHKSLDCSDPKNIAKYYQVEMGSLDHEEVKVLFLDRKNVLIRDQLISRGGLSASVIYPRDVFKEALKANAASIILMHNHPSGNIVPSEADIETSKSFVKAGEMLGINVWDHLIFGKNNYLSLASNHKYQHIFL